MGGGSKSNMSDATKTIDAKRGEGAGLAPVRGTREYLPSEQLVRERITDVLKYNFKRYGYGPIETSILESYEVAASKYGGGSEILKETYRLTDQGGRDLALRYELTFKLGKLIGMNPTMRLPFKRYEIGKVFRDGPIKTGRLREFTQCDADVVGVKSQAADAEFIKMSFDMFSDLGIPVFVQLNNRKLLFGLADAAGIDKEMHTEVALSLDKLEKFGEDSVRKELADKRIDSISVQKLFRMLNEAQSKPTNAEKLAYLEAELPDGGLGREGAAELKGMLKYAEDLGVRGDLRLVPTLARGLGYYTGPMWEVYAKESRTITGSLAAGGRWDDMIGSFIGSKEQYPATGMTFGLDVIYAALEEKGFKGLAGEQMKVPTVLVIPIGALDKSLSVANGLRERGISTDVAYDTRLSKALDYADKQSIPYVMIVGERGLKEGKITVRDMSSGKEHQLNAESVSEELAGILKETLGGPRG